MSEYAERFAGNDIDMAVLPDLTDLHLKDPWRFARTPVENVARDPRSQWRFSCRNGACGTRGKATTSAEPWLEVQMRKELPTVRARRSIFKVIEYPLLGAALICYLDVLPEIAAAQHIGITDRTETREWAPPAIQHAQQMRKYKDSDHGSQSTPNVISRFSTDEDPSGEIATFQPGATTFTANNAFFQDLGTNGRTCFTCHQPQNGWTISASDAYDRFEDSRGTDPLFRLVDGATCPTDDVSTIGAKRKAYELLINKGLIRIGLPLPPAPNLQFEVAHVDDPYNCTTNPSTGLTSPTSGIVSIYRRPLPSTNLRFLTTIMWDGREPTLEDQANDATLIHAQANTVPTSDQQAQIVIFENGIFTSQILDEEACDLDECGGSGDPVALARQFLKFFVGINDPLGENPTGAPFDANIFNLYKPWLSLQGKDEETRHRRSVARGEEVFNTTKISITGVAGLNDDLHLPKIDGFCGTCHDTPDVGNHSVKLPLNIGVADAGADSPPALDISGLPVFTLRCTNGPLAGKMFVVTDPGRALISGNCADIGKVKGPILRGLAARAPYFHNGSAATLLDVVNFYDQRFGIGFTRQQKDDLVNFLSTL
jgi:cytochrome c peroxidase